jgi:hypothetical protein
MSKVVIASGVVTGTHAITVELVAPAVGDRVISISWPPEPSSISLRDFAPACDAVLKTLAEAQARVEAIRAEEL